MTGNPRQSLRHLLTYGTIAMRHTIAVLLSAYPLGGYTSIISIHAKKFKDLYQDSKVRACGNYLNAWYDWMFGFRV